MPCAESKFVQPPFCRRYKPAPSVPTHNAPSGAGSTDSTGRPFHLSGGETVSKLFGRITTRPAPVPHQRFFSRSSHKEITQSDGSPLVRAKCSAGVFVWPGKTTHRPVSDVPPASAPAEVSIMFATMFQPQGASPKSATHWPSFHLRMRLSLATQNPPSRAAQRPCT
jgi:hypothetical protein